MGRRGACTNACRARRNCPATKSSSEPSAVESKVRRLAGTQEFGTIPGQVPPGQKPQVQGTPGNAAIPAIIPGRPDLERQGHLGRQAPDGQVQGRPDGQFGQGFGQLPLPAGPVPPAVAQGKGADLYGNQLRPQVVKEPPGPGLAPGVAVDRADER